MKKIFAFIAIIAISVSIPADAQVLKGLGQALKNAATEVAKSAAEAAVNEAEKALNLSNGETNQTQTATQTQSETQTTAQTQTTAYSSVSNNASAAVSSATTTAPSTPKGNVYYVSESGSNRADGRSAATPMKDIQKALNAIYDAKDNGATIRVAQGNYLGYLDAGYIEIKNFITLEGGWNADFSARDPFTYVTMMRPTAAQAGTNGTKALITISELDNVSYTIDGTLVIDGIMLDFGDETNYHPYDPTDTKSGSPEGVDTGRMVDDPAKQVQHSCIHTDAAVAGNVIIRNCLFLNSPYFGIQINTRCGEVEICNNVFVSNRMGACRVDGWDKEGYRSHVNFHHNSVGFSWTRDKFYEDMGYGYEFMNKVSGDVHNNIFFCNSYAAIARTRSLSGPDAVIEAKKVTNVFENYFYMNAADIQLPSSGGGKWTNVMVKQFDDIDEKTIPNINGNKNLDPNDPFVAALWQPYLNGYANLEVLDSSSSFDANSPANLYRQAHGMNMQGSEIHRVSMYGNRYRFDEAMKLFGAKASFGAQK